MPVLSPEYLSSLLVELCKQPAETGWLEFKKNIASPGDIGEYISALANTAALHGKAGAYLIWGVRDKTHEIVGTTFRPALAKKGNETARLRPRSQIRQTHPALGLKSYLQDSPQKEPAFCN
jgi:predicted HTH transcriptional regulator